MGYDAGEYFVWERFDITKEYLALESIARTRLDKIQEIRIYT